MTKQIVTLEAVLQLNLKNEEVLQVDECILGVQHQSCRSLLFESLALLIVLQNVREIGVHLNR